MKDTPLRQCPIRPVSQEAAPALALTAITSDGRVRCWPASVVDKILVVMAIGTVGLILSTARSRTGAAHLSR